MILVEWRLVVGLLFCLRIWFGVLLLEAAVPHDTPYNTDFFKCVVERE
jgi:hypothetical protein